MMDKVPIEIITLFVSAFTYLAIDVIPVFQKYKAYVVVILAGAVCFGLAFTAVTRDEIVTIFWAIIGSGTMNGVVKTFNRKRIQ